MNRLICSLVFGVSLAGCSPGGDDAGSSDNMDSVQPEARADTERSAGTDASALSGEAAYYMACASCHETGAGDAPLTGDLNAWSDRSSLWQAVLAEHANKGYMEMPAKGGSIELSDWVVIRATEYMLSLTYPELPPDQ